MILRRISLGPAGSTVDVPYGLASDPAMAGEMDPVTIANDVSINRNFFVLALVIMRARLGGSPSNIYKRTGYLKIVKKP